MASATAHKLASRYDLIQTSFSKNSLQLIHLHNAAINQLLPSLAASENLSPFAIELAAGFLNDKISLFRFLHRAEFNSTNALAALAISVQSRISSKIDLIDPLSLEPVYLEQPLLFFHPELKDKWGRMCAVLNLKNVTRTPDGSLDGLKNFVAWTWEAARRSLYESEAARIDELCAAAVAAAETGIEQPQPGPHYSPALESVLIVDLKDASMNNLEVELLPYFIDLLKTNFPGMVGAIFILNYGWMYAGMWQLAKRLLPQSTLDRIVFASTAELRQFFAPNGLLVEHGGTVAYTPVGPPYPLTASPARPPVAERPHPSRHPSMESLLDVFFSAANTPLQPSSRPGTPGRGHRPAWLSMSAVSHDFSAAVARNAAKARSHLWAHVSPPDDLHLELARAVEPADSAAGSSTTPLASPRSSSSSSSSSLHAPDTDERNRNRAWPLRSRHSSVSHRVCDSKSGPLSLATPGAHLPLSMIRRPAGPVGRRRKRDLWLSFAIRASLVTRTLQMALRGFGGGRPGARWMGVVVVLMMIAVRRRRSRENSL